MSLTVRQLTARYRQQTVLHGVNLDLAAGQLAALVGPNGSGKSTLLRCLAGLMPHAGTVVLSGGSDAGGAVGYMPQDTSATAALTVMETVLLGRVRRLRWQVGDDDLSAVAAVLRRLGITDLAQRGLRELSGGQRQLVFLAQALVAEPRVLLLDEPISALDLRHQLEVMQTVQQLTRERALVSLAVLHDLNVAARYADHLLLLREGRIWAQGPVDDAFSLANIEPVFGIEADLLRGGRVAAVLVPWRPAPVVDGERTPSVTG